MFQRNGDPQESRKCPGCTMKLVESHVGSWETGMR